MTRFLGPQEYGNFPYPPGYLYGFETSNNLADTTNDINFGPGKCRDNEDTDNIVHPIAFVKRMDSVWTVGTNGGLKDKADAETSEWFHLHAIKNPTTGAVDYVSSVSHDRVSVVTVTAANPAQVLWVGHGLPAGATITFSRTTGNLPAPLVTGQVYYVLATGLTANVFSLSLTNGGAAIDTTGSSQSGTHYARGQPILPSGYTVYRRVWSIRRSSNINRLYTQWGDRCYWQSPLLDINTTAPGTALRQDSFAASVPYGHRTLAMIRLYTGDNAVNIIFRGPGSADSAISGTAAPLFDHGTNAALTGFKHFVPTNNTAIIEWKCNVASSLNGVRMATEGYIDYRGRIG